jgi:alpha-amylase/alpha-mannosidase (GH57 family)
LVGLSRRGHVCIHGHWYQPPRENPFTGTIGVQPSAAPYRDWNERITAECYAPNARAEILGDDGAVTVRVNNYEHVSSDWGPTLLAWMEKHHPEVHQAVVDSDRVSRERHDGHGNAVAHTYNHTILPLSNRRDKRTQILWGIADFKHRFGRDPEGLWLPETAVDLETLDLAAEAGIGFTILAPRQAMAVYEAGQWVETSDGSIDPRMPYEVSLAGNRRIAVFFYDGAVSQEIAFNGLLEDGAVLASRLVEALGDPEPDALLAHVATDGETYGHHHRHGEMALAKAVELLEADPEIELTNYGRFLADHPPTRMARIHEDTAWSCAHGVDRWRDDCGCSTGANQGWDQQWRRPLRDALDHLRDALSPRFEELGSTVLADPWAARDSYIEVILGGEPGAFLDRHGSTPDDADRRRLALDLLEIQHRAMLMYTSCGWFFDDITGLESVFVLRQAGRVIELARTVHDLDLEPGFLAILEQARSNVDGQSGRTIYEESVLPFMASAQPA